MNHALSPYTGWTRADWESAVETTLASVRPYASPRHALIDLPGPESISGRRSDGFEGFARTFLAAGFHLAHRPNGNLIQWYAEGLAAGVDPSSPERWPRVTEVNQAKVEAASIAIALHETRHVLWDTLDDRVREQTVAWLAECIGQPYPACNWLWFQNVVEAFLRSVGGPWSAEDIDGNIATMEDWYLGDGWYTDGVEGQGFESPGTMRNFDWYAGWAMNFYPLWYCRMSDVDASLWTRYRERLRAYLDGAQHLFAPDGPPLHQGRSLTYRYAALAPIWAGAIFDATPLAPGATRRLASGVLRHFGVDGGVQPIGWYGPLEPIRQPYSGPGSPYWSSKGFAGLVLPPDHPVWTDVERPLPVEERDVAFALPVPGWLVSATRADGVVRVVNHGTDHADDEAFSTDEPGYSRHAYSTHAGPDYGTPPVDNHVALLAPDGTPSHRRPLHPVLLEGRFAVSTHETHWPVGSPPPRTWPPRQPSFRAGPSLTTASVLRGPIEVRLATVIEASPKSLERLGGRPDHGSGAASGGAPGSVEASGSTEGWVLRIGGYALAADDAPPTTATDGAAASATRPDGLTSTVVGLRGLPVARIVERSGANAFGTHSATPVVETAGPAQLGEIYAAAIIFGGSTGPPPALPTVTVTSTTVTVHWPDAETDTIPLPP